MITTRQAKREDVVYLSSRLRPEDVSEIQAASGRSPLDALLLSLEVSRICRTMHYRSNGYTDPTPFAIYGVADDPNDSTVGVVWLLSTVLHPRHRHALVRVAPKLLASLCVPYSRGLHNIVDARNLLHIRWLQLTGFKRLGAVMHNGHRFIHAAWYKQNV